MFERCMFGAATHPADSISARTGSGRSFGLSPARRPVIVGQLTRLGHDQIVVFREVHDEVERHRLDIAQTRIDDDTL
jgi:hypothetical protein